MVFKAKYNSDGNVERHIARLVAKGFTQRSGFDYEETFTPEAKQETIKMVLSMAAKSKWKMDQLDIKSTFLNGYLEESYIQHPKVFEVKGKDDCVY